MKKYEALYLRLKGDIESGILPEGEKLLSIREESLSSALSVNTVLKAYDMLVDEGLVLSRERGGFYVSGSALSDLGEEGFGFPESFSEKIASASGETGMRLDQLYEHMLHLDADFACAAPGSDLLPSREMAEIAAGLSGRWMEYGHPEGDYALRRRIALVNRETDGPADPGDLVITSGATEALTIVLNTLLRPGDTVVLESPSYINFFRQLAPLGVNLLEIPMGRDGLDLNMLEHEMGRQRIRMVLVQPHVQNPTGITMTERAKADLIELAQKNGALIVQDDVYGDLSFSPLRPRNLTAMSDYDGIILISSCSKTVSPGLRTGWIRSSRYAEEFAEEKLRLSMETSRLSQAVLAAFWGTKAYRRHMRMIRESLRNRIGDYLICLSGILPEGCSVRRPSGGCLLWIAFPRGTDGTNIFESLAGRGLILAPGALFSSSSRFNSYLRINGGNRLTRERREVLSLLGQIFKD